MTLRQTKLKNGDMTLTIIESYRKNGKTTTRTVMRCGRLSELKKEFENPIAHFTELTKQMTKEHRESISPVTIEVYPQEKINPNKTYRKNVGSAVPLSIYNLLEIEIVLRNAVANSHIHFDVNAVTRLLIIERLLHPCSKIAAFENKDGYFFRTEFSKDDVYKTLDILCNSKDSIISKINSSIDKKIGRNKKNIFYDVTNYYFECDPDDFRKKGVSKEHRPNPIIQMGLLQDSNALPITYELFPGNTNDSQTMLPVLKKFKKDYELQSITAVADKGLNCAVNMAALVASGDGFIFSQSIKGTKSEKEICERVLNEQGYSYKKNGAYKRKSWQGYKQIKLKASETASGKSKTINLEVKYVAFWSRKYAERDRIKRLETLEKSIELIKNPGKYTRATHFGASKYVKGVNFDSKTGEVLHTEKALLLDEELIEKEAATDGYYLIVTNRTDWSDDEIIDSYQELWKIEETFKITKSDIESRPVYLRKKTRIEAHFLTCFIALTILRLLQYKLDGRPSAKSIIESLSGLSCTNIGANWWSFDKCSDLLVNLFKSVSLEFPTRNMKTGQIKKLMQKNKI